MNNELLRNPTVPLWREELTLLLHGKRDYDVRDLGSAEEYVLRVLRDSEDPRKCKAVFNLVLSEEVTAWQVGLDESPYFMRAILQLICAFTPAPGFVKAIELVERRMGDGALERGAEQDVQLGRIAVTALGRFYRTAPPFAENDRAYGRYVELLKDLAEIPSFASLAMRQLLELGAAELTDRDFAREVIADPTMMNVAVGFAMKGPLRRSTKQLQALFDSCIRAGFPAVAAFRDELGANDARLYLTNDHAVVAMISGEKIKLRVAPEAVSDYAMVWLQMAQSSGLAAWDRATA